MIRIVPSQPRPTEGSSGHYVPNVPALPNGSPSVRHVGRVERADEQIFRAMYSAAPSSMDPTTASGCPASGCAPPRLAGGPGALAAAAAVQPGGGQHAGVRRLDPRAPGGAAPGPARPAARGGCAAIQPGGGPAAPRGGPGRARGPGHQELRRATRPAGRGGRGDRAGAAGRGRGPGLAPPGRADLGRAGGGRPARRGRRRDAGRGPVRAGQRHRGHGWRGDRDRGPVPARAGLLHPARPAH